MKVQVVWNITLYQLVNSYQDSGELVVSIFKSKMSETLIFIPQILLNNVPDLQEIYVLCFVPVYFHD